MTTCIKIRAYKNTYKRRSTYAHNYIVCKEYNLHMRRSTYAHNYIVCKEYNLHIYKDIQGHIQGRRDPFCFFSPSYKDTCKDTYKHTYKDMPTYKDTEGCIRTHSSRRTARPFSLSLTHTPHTASPRSCPIFIIIITARPKDRRLLNFCIEKSIENSV